MENHCNKLVLNTLSIALKLPLQHMSVDDFADCTSISALKISGRKDEDFGPHLILNPEIQTGAFFAIDANAKNAKMTFYFVFMIF